MMRNLNYHLVNFFVYFQSKHQNNILIINIITINTILKNLNQQFSFSYLALKFILLLLFNISIAYKVVELFSCTHCIWSFEVCDFSLNFLSLLDRVSAHQAPTDISTESHSHQIIKNIKTNIKTPKTTAFST